MSRNIKQRTLFQFWLQPDIHEVKMTKQYLFNELIRIGGVEIPNPDPIGPAQIKPWSKVIVCQVSRIADEINEPSQYKEPYKFKILIRTNVPKFERDMTEIVESIFIDMPGHGPFKEYSRDQLRTMSTRDQEEPVYCCVSSDNETTAVRAITSLDNDLLYAGYVEEEFHLSYRVHRFCRSYAASGRYFDRDLPGCPIPGANFSLKVINQLFYKYQAEHLLMERDALEFAAAVDRQVELDNQNRAAEQLAQNVINEELQAIEAIEQAARDRLAEEAHERAIQENFNDYYNNHDQQPVNEQIVQHVQQANEQNDVAMVIDQQIHDQVLIIDPYFIFDGPLDFDLDGLVEPNGPIQTPPHIQHK